jgi:predicted RNA-binding protein with PIN domain
VILPPATFIVDGDNLIGSWGGLRPGDDRHAEVVARVAAACERLDAEAVVVFDRVSKREAAGQSPRVTIREAEPGQSGDDVIRVLVDTDADPSRLTVVTSDKPLYSYARTRGAKVLRTHEWRRLEQGR